MRLRLASWRWARFARTVHVLSVRYRYGMRSLRCNSSIHDALSVYAWPGWPSFVTERYQSCMFSIAFGVVRLSVAVAVFNNEASLMVALLNAFSALFKLSFNRANFFGGPDEGSG